MERCNLSQQLKILVGLLLIVITSCKQPATRSANQPAVNQPATRPPLLGGDQAQEVLRILATTDALDKMIRAGNAGQPFVDLAAKAEIDYMRCQQKLPQQNAARIEFRRIIDGYATASALIAGKVQNSKQTPFDLVAEAWTRKTMLKKVLEGKATEREWQVFELAHKEAN